MSGDAGELKRILAERAESVAELLLPGGRRERDEWLCGSTSGEPGKSLKVRLRGPKAGVWSDFATGDAGDLIDLWQEVRGGSFVKTLDDIRDWCGIEQPDFSRASKKFQRPDKPVCTVPRGRVLDYLVEDRNIPAEVVTKYKIGDQGGNILFPFLRDGELIMAKAREPVDGATPRPISSGYEQCLFGWQAIDDNDRSVVLTEGEIDALSMAAYGYPALSVPQGGGGGAKQQWIENEFDRLGRFETIYLALDDDEVGQEAVEEIASRLGQHRCRVVNLPRKDANECLVDGVATAVIAACIEEADTQDPEQLTRPIDLRDNVMGLLFPPDGEEPGYTLPFAKTAGKVRFRPGEVTVWTGSTGSGKSQLVSYCTAHWIAEGSKVCVASLEMAPAQQLRRMVKQVACTGVPSQDFADRTLEWIDAGMMVFDLVGKAKVSRILEIFDYARARYGCDQFVIDSLMRLGMQTDDYNAQEETMYQIVDWAVARGVHVHFVCHSRKAEQGKGPATADEIKGPMELGANAFNIVTVWRDRHWEELAALRDAGSPLTDKQTAYLERYPVTMTVVKQRNGDWEGRVGLRFNQDNYQYAGSGDDSMHGRRFMPVVELVEDARDW